MWSAQGREPSLKQQTGVEAGRAVHSSGKLCKWLCWLLHTAFVGSSHRSLNPVIGKAMGIEGTGLGDGGWLCNDRRVPVVTPPTQSRARLGAPGSSERGAPGCPQPVVIYSIRSDAVWMEPVVFQILRLV